jgi:hypothetical protein
VHVPLSRRIAAINQWVLLRQQRDVRISGPLYSCQCGCIRLAGGAGVDEALVASVEDAQLHGGKTGVVAMSTGRYCFDDFVVRSATPAR